MTHPNRFITPAAILAAGLILAAAFAGETLVLSVLGRAEPFSARALTILLFWRMLLLAAGLGLLFDKARINAFGGSVRVRQLTLRFFAIALPFIVLAAIEIILALAAPHMGALASYGRTYDFAAFENYQAVNAVQGASSDWRRKGFIERDGLKTYPPINAPGLYINRQGLRTRELEDSRPDAIRVALLGGSSVWGSNVRDEDTIAAYLESLPKAEQSPKTEVFNLGVEGYGFELETRMLVRMKEKIRFRTAVFYHGHNDFFGSFKLPPGERRKAAPDKPLVKSLRSFTTYVLAEALLLDVMERLGTDDEKTALDERSRRIVAYNVDWYRERHAKALGICVEAKIICHFFLQPTLLNRRIYYEWEENIARNLRRRSPGIGVIYNAILDGVAALGLENVHDARRFLDDVPRGVFGDQVHVNRYGNKAIAGKLAGNLK